MKPYPPWICSASLTTRRETSPAIEFRKRGGLHVVAAVVFLPRGAQDHELGMLDLAEHVDELELRSPGIC